MKVCCVCNKEKPFADFYKRGENGYQAKCKDCKSKYNQKHYLDNKKQYIEKARIWSNQRTETVRELKKSVGCQVCGESEPCCLDYHHLSDKSFGLAEARGKAWDKVLEEINKCVVLCKNCHAKVHAGIIDLSGINSTVE